MKREGYATVTTYRPHSCPQSTHSQNKRITVKDMQGRADIYHNMPNVPYMPMYRGRELAREKLDGNEGESFQLIPSYVEKLEAADPST